jgi:hypothetical protein
MEATLAHQTIGVDQNHFHLPTNEQAIKFIEEFKMISRKT